MLKSPVFRDCLIILQKAEESLILDSPLLVGCWALLQGNLLSPLTSHFVTFLLPQFLCRDSGADS